MRYNPLPDRQIFYFGQLKDQCTLYMLLFNGSLTDIKLPGLAVMIGRPGRSVAQFTVPHRLAGADNPMCRASPRVMFPTAPGVRLVIYPAFRVMHRHMTILLKIPYRAFGCINRD